MDPFSSPYITPNTVVASFHVLFRSFIPCYIEVRFCGSYLGVLVFKYGSG